MEFVARDRPMVAKDILQKIRRRAEALHIAAEKGRLVPELERHGIREYGQLVISVWRIVYKVSENRVDVLLVFDSRRNIEDIMLMRLSRRQ